MIQISNSTLDFIAALGELSSAGEIVGALKHTVSEFGIEYASVFEAPEPGKKLAELAFSGVFPNGFLAGYDACNFLEIDPITPAQAIARRPFVWESVFQREGSKRQSQLLDYFRDFKLEKGLMIPIRSSSQLVGTVWIAGPRIDVRPAFWPLVQVIATSAFERLRMLNNTRRSEIHRVSDREREVLLWVAKGKSAWEIGQILGIGRRTVESHVTSAVTKLEAGNRTHAVALAMRDGIIAI